MNTKRFFLFLGLALSLSLIFSSCGKRDTTTPIEGEWDGEHYTNARALFEVEVPDGLTLSAPICLDEPSPTMKVHSYAWEIRSKKGREGGLYYYEPVSEDDHFEYHKLYHQYKEDPATVHVERIGPWYKATRIKIVADMNRDGKCSKEVIYSRYDSNLILIYPTDEQFHNETMEAFADGMKVTALYENVLGSVGMFPISIWFILLLAASIALLCVDERYTLLTVLTIVAALVSIVGVCVMTDCVPCRSTYVLFVISVLFVAWPWLYKTFPNIMGKVGKIMDFLD